MIVTGYSRTGDNEDTIARVLNRLLDDILSQDNSCSSWLKGPDFTAAQFVQAILGNGPSDYTFGYGVLSDPDTAAFVGNKNVGGTPVQGLLIDASITINSTGAFFNLAYTVGPSGYKGDSLQAQAFILLHELAHEVGAQGFRPDAGSKEIGKANDKLVDKNCGSEIKGLQ